jgi:hypothetical protein
MQIGLNATVTVTSGGGLTVLDKKIIHHIASDSLPFNEKFRNEKLF